MKNLKVALICFPLLLLSSCVPILSLHQWYTDTDLVLEPGLAGEWYSVNDDGKVDTSTTLTIVQNLPQGYTLSVNDDAHPDVRQTYAVHLFRLKGHLFVDANQAATYYKTDVTDDGGMMIPGHMAGKIAIESDNIHAEFVEDDWIKNALKSDPGLIRNERVSDNIYLTASEDELQQFLLNSPANEKAFAFKLKLRRTSASATPAPAKP
ncbi:MAG TPA: hypothetical protein VEJ39_02560 [Candidatus Acidoferrales bacterium]|nr:hypothetical protein [Candidatus Acidoferrales bacterium]